MRKLLQALIIFYITTLGLTGVAGTEYFFKGGWDMDAAALEALAGPAADVYPSELGDTGYSYRITLADMPAELLYQFNEEDRLAKIFISLKMQDMTAAKFNAALQELTTGMNSAAAPCQYAENQGEEHGKYHFRYSTRQWLNESFYADLVAITPIEGQPHWEVENNGGYSLKIVFIQRDFYDTARFNTFD